HVEGGRCTIIDLHSQNGTWLNGLRVQRAEVRPDAEIAIGLYRLKLELTTVSDDRTSVNIPAPPMPGLDRQPQASRAAAAAAMATAELSRPIARRAPAVTKKLDEPINVAPAAAPPRSRLPLVIGAVAAVVVIAILVGRFTAPGSSTKADTPAAASSAIPA